MSSIFVFFGRRAKQYCCFPASHRPAILLHNIIIKKLTHHINRHFSTELYGVFHI